MTSLSPEVQALGLFMPRPVALKLLSSGGKLEPVEAKATVMLCDIESFAAAVGKTAERCPDIRLRRVDEAMIRGHTEPVILYTPAEL
jgi:hypothetical protein